MDLIILYQLWGSHNLACDNVNHAMMNGYDIMSSHVCNLSDFIRKAQFEKVYLSLL